MLKKDKQTARPRQPPGFAPGLASAFIGVLLLALGPASALAEKRHAIAFHGVPKEPAGFTHFSYTNPDAPKGGQLVLGVMGSFDSLNPLIVKGTAAAGLRELVFESLMARGLDEPFSLYGLLAESVEMPDDRSSITFNLNPLARFSDGSPVTADDVIFSWEVLKTKGRPNHRTYFAKVAKAEKLSGLSVRFTFDAAGDREIPLILGLMPVLPKRLVSAETFEQSSLAVPVGSGPYVISRVNAGRSITYTRNATYWGRDLGVNRGRFNFGTIRYDYYLESSVLLEAFKTGPVDLRLEEDPRTWATAYDFAAVRDGRIVKATFPIALPAGMTALTFNTRRPMFADPRVRLALIYLFDAERINKSLYHGLFRRTASFFERSFLSSAGKPANERERQLLAPYLATIKPDVLEGRHAFPVSAGNGQNRENQREALRLLNEAGYELRGRRLVSAATGQRMRFEILAASTSQEGLLLTFAHDLAQLGISASIRIVDSTQYQHRLMDYDFDMIQYSWPSSLSPGNEQLFRWSKDAARTPGSYNYPGVASDAADAMISAMLGAGTEDEFVSAVRALDRVLLSGDYVIPLYHIPVQWVAHWTKLRHPASTPQFGYNLDAWWAAEVSTSARTK